MISFLSISDISSQKSMQDIILLLKGHNPGIKNDDTGYIHDKNSPN